MSWENDHVSLVCPTVNGFPPQDISGFLLCCAGEWLALRSRLTIGGEGQGGDDDEWHESERGELKVEYLEPDHAGAPGGLMIHPPLGGPQRLVFLGDGLFISGERKGEWRLCPDSSLELTMRQEGSEVRERIWFTKSNLRLRSSVEHRADGSPGRASFSTEIRRLPPPPVARG